MLVSKINISQYKAIIFDMDGVLLNSNNNKVVAMERTIEEYGNETRDRFMDYFKSNFGRSRSDHFREFIDILDKHNESDLTEYLDNQYSKYCIKAYQDSEIIDGVQALLNSLQLANIRMFVASGSPQNSAIEILSDKGLGDYFETILGGPESKVDNLEKIKRVMGHDKLLFIGDSLHDIQCAKLTNIDFALFPKYSLNLHKDLIAQAEECSYGIINSFNQLMECDSV